MPAHGDWKELRAILKVLHEKDPSSWPPVLMLSALRAGGIYIDGTTTESEMRRLTEALSKSAQKQWAVEAKIMARAGSKIKDNKFKDFLASVKPTDESTRTWSNDDSILSERRGFELSRQLAELDAMVQESSRNLHEAQQHWTPRTTSKYSLPRHPAHLGGVDYRDQLRAILVPEWANDTLWSLTVDAVMRCNLHPHVVTPR